MCFWTASFYTHWFCIFYFEYLSNFQSKYLSKHLTEQLVLLEKHLISLCTWNQVLWPLLVEKKKKNSENSNFGSFVAFKISLTIIFIFWCICGSRPHLWTHPRALQRKKIGNHWVKWLDSLVTLRKVIWLTLFFFSLLFCTSSSHNSLWSCRGRQFNWETHSFCYLDLSQYAPLQSQAQMLY